jgi:hypothetical protein
MVGLGHFAPRDSTLFPGVRGRKFSEVPIAPVQHEGGLIYRAWAMAFRSYRAPLAHPLAS